jgi:hypothetical protein
MHKTWQILQSFIPRLCTGAIQADKGIAMYGEAAIATVLKELQQLYDHDVIEPKMTNELTVKERKSALDYRMFIKEKHDMTIKGRGCAESRKQQTYTSKDEASSQTVSTKSVMLLCVLNVMEHCGVARVDIPNAFMQAGMEGIVYMKMVGKTAELLIKINKAK